MTAGFGSEPESFDDFIAHFFGGEPGDPRRLTYQVDIARLMSAPTKAMVAAAAEFVATRGGIDLGAEHLLWASTRISLLAELLRVAGADPDELARQVHELTPGGPVAENMPSLTPAAKRALLDAHHVAQALGSEFIGPDHVLLALSTNEESPAGQLLRTFGVTPDGLQRAAAELETRAAPQVGTTQRAGGAAQIPTQIPMLDSFSTDLTAAARAGRLDPVIGRDSEIEQTVEVLARRTKNNPVLIGEAGVGKTAIVEGIAQRIVDGDVPTALAGRRVVSLQLSTMVAGTRYRGDFEERITQVIDEIRVNADELIVFIDELHTVVGAGTGSDGGGMDASNMLKPALARGELHVIGATTLDEYRRKIECDAALERRFQPILVPEPSVADSVHILTGLRDRYEAHHQVRYTDGAVHAAASLADRYLTDRFLPDKAVDLLDQAGARVRLKVRGPANDVRELERRVAELERDKGEAVAAEDYERASTVRDQLGELRREADSARGSGGDGVPEVGAVEIAEIVARSTGIPTAALTEAERDRLVRLGDDLHARVVGQDEAVRVVAEAVRRSRAGVADPARPVGSFLFLGPTGVGKTELAKALAASLFGDEARLVRIDMSEYTERHTVNRLVGAPPGYLGYDDAGQLTEQVRRRPYSVVLLDEMEKAHPDVFHTLLQVLDDGRLTDGHGRTVNFRNAVVIMTSNVGSEAIASTTSLGFGGTTDRGDDETVRAKVMSQLKETFRPEFLNRVDEIVVFHRLGDDELRLITELLLAELRQRVGELGVRVHTEPAALSWLARRGHQPEFGARPLRRAIQHEVGNRLSAMLLGGELSRGDEVRIAVADDELTFSTAPAG
ncbi:MAG: ATP-dependent Clp protease ATP-binding subunit ClpC [Pseudonocardiales bacterium]|nr:ATP-dependent Clp protease ATP-binding subunit ClpC [Pseudonocardiales bacterium]